LSRGEPRPPAVPGSGPNPAPVEAVFGDGYALSAVGEVGNSTPWGVVMYAATGE
jgi:hypothetical protein